MTTLIEEAQAEANKIMAEAMRKTKIAAQLPDAIPQKPLIVLQNGFVQLLYKDLSFKNLRDLIESYKPLAPSHIHKCKTMNYANSAGWLHSSNPDWEPIAQGAFVFKSHGFPGQNHFEIVFNKVLEDGTKIEVDVQYQGAYYDKAQKVPDMMGHIEQYKSRFRPLEYIPHRAPAMAYCFKIASAATCSIGGYNYRGLIKDEATMDNIILQWEKDYGVH